MAKGTYLSAAKVIICRLIHAVHLTTDGDIQDGHRSFGWGGLGGLGAIDRLQDDNIIMSELQGCEGLSDRKGLSASLDLG